MNWDTYENEKCNQSISLLGFNNSEQKGRAKTTNS